MLYNRYPLRCGLAVVAIFLSLATYVSAADGQEPPDDGVVEPYVPPQDHLDYVASLDPNLVPTLQADPAMLEEWQDGRFGVFLPDEYEADAIRRDFERWSRRFSINQINAYQSL